MRKGADMLTLYPQILPESCSVLEQLARLGKAGCYSEQLQEQPRKALVPRGGKCFPPMKEWQHGALDEGWK